MAVYISVSTSLTNQIDAKLIYSANSVLKSMRAGALGEIKMPELDLFADVYIQVWNTNAELEARSQNIQRYFTPLDKNGLTYGKPVFRDVQVGNNRLRVLTVPMVTAGSERQIGTLQVATSLDIVAITQRVLLVVLFAGAGLSMLAAGLAGWISTNQVLTPLEAVTETALQITRADDLSRRIPYDGPPGDEVGQLITAFNQTLSRLENLFNSQRRFLADVGHELRTPLTVIRGNIDLMRRMQQTDEESMDSIQSEVDRLTRLVGDLLLLAQAESGKITLVKKVVELDSLVLEALSQMRVLTKDRLRLTLGEIDQVLVCGDEDRLKQVLVNLIGNAINYTPSGGEVVVGVGKENDRARVTVSDNGPGIPKEDLPHVFERFYRGEKSRTRSRDGKGFGLGLSIAYWIVRNHDGKIEVASSEGGGTTFCIWLPLAKGGCQSSENLPT
ncbi:MAG: HAMP domain-containing histidine kinase [Anaerolineales bacterium]|nr:HAMP domain-containing histidine kinase [Anaerolineales bacterium]